MSFVFNEAEFKKESEEFYSTYPADVSEIEKELNQRYKKEKVSAMVQKKWTYEAIAQKCKVKIFRYCPFLFRSHYRKGQKFSCRGISSNTRSWVLGTQNTLSGKGI